MQKQRQENKLEDKLKLYIEKANREILLTSSIPQIQRRSILSTLISDTNPDK